jgi:serine/threonine protein kinase
LKIFPIYYSINVIEFYGITQEPITHNYTLVMEFKDCNLYSYLHKNYDSLTLNDKLDIIKYICLGLDCIHNHNT